MVLHSTAISLPTVLTLEHSPNRPATVMPSDLSQGKDFIHYRVLTLLKQHPDLSQRDMAQRLGISNGGMHYCLSALMDKGLVKLGNFASSKHKLGYVYLLTPQGMAQKAAMASRFLERKIAEYEALQAEIASLKADAQSATVAITGGQAT
jgi:EPS-associated MarR family transcriptional regulator